MFFDPRELAAPAIPAISAIPGAPPAPADPKNSKVAKIAGYPGRTHGDQPPPLTDADHEDMPHRLWVVSTGAETRSVSFCPPAALSEVMKLYPDARVEPAPEPDPNPPPLPPDVVATVNRWLDHIGEHHEADRAELLRNCAANPEALAGLLGIIAEAGIITASPSPEPTPEPVTCGGCLHFEPDRTGDGSGLGACRIDAPASRRPPALWPNAPHRCLDWSGSTANNDPHGDIEAKR